MFRNICSVLCFVILCFFIVGHISINNDLTPDSKLYYGLSENIKSGVGYYDTIRNSEILPPVGHPLLLLALGYLTTKITIVQLFLGLLSLVFAVAIYTRSNIITLILCFCIFLTLRSVAFLNYGIEASIFMLSSFLILSFVYVYKNDFSLFSIIISSIFVAVHILVRPLLFYPVVLFVLTLIGYSIYIYIKYKAFSFYSRRIKMVLVGFLSIFIIVGAVSTLSLVCYGDKRLTKGTYSSIPLYVANNEYIPVDIVYSSNVLSTYVPKDKINYLFSVSDGWEKRQSRIFNEVVKYVFQHPKRAVAGWLWRFSQYTGVAFNVSDKLFVYTVLVYLNFLLILLLIIICVVKKNHAFLFSSLGLLIITLLMMQIFQMALFVWVGGYRFLVPLIPFLVTGVLFSLFEVKTLLTFKEN